VFDKISNFHRQFKKYILKKSGFSVKKKGGALELALLYMYLNSNKLQKYLLNKFWCMK
jgi:hypothetical protein